MNERLWFFVPFSIAKKRVKGEEGWRVRSVRMFGSAYPKYGKIFRLLHRSDFTVFGNNGCPKAFGGGAEKTIRKRHRIAGLKFSGSTVNLIGDGTNNPNRKIENRPHFMACNFFCVNGTS
jgi:hypothetical protein